MAPDGYRPIAASRVPSCGRHTDAVDPLQGAAWAALCVLASGSGGNCSVLRVARVGSNGRAGTPSAILLDAGLSPRQTRLRLRQVGVRPEEVVAIVLTHLDSDHWHAGWMEAMGAGRQLYVHARHYDAGRLAGVIPRGATPFADAFEPLAGVHARSVLAPHDELDVAAFRFESDRVGSLGYATDLGSADRALVELLAGVDLLAIESNYCPQLERAARRPEFVKQRVMSDRGHLSNAQCLAAVQQIRPRRHVVALHLSRQCNRHELVAQLHAGAPYRLTIAEQDRPTSWIPLDGAQPWPPIRPGMAGAMDPAGTGLEAAAPGLSWDGRARGARRD